MYMHTCVCAHLCVCLSAGHTSPAHIWKSEHRISLFSLLFLTVSVEELASTPPRSLLFRPVLSRKHARTGHSTTPSRTWVLERCMLCTLCTLCMHDLMLTYWALSPPLFLFTYFFFLWILQIYAEFMGYSHLMVGIHMGKVSSGDLYHAMNSTESTYLR